jgi:hypothetical protein
MFTEESRATAVTGSAENGDFNYKVDYKTDGNKLIKLHCNIYKKTTETEAELYVGFMLNESGNKQFSFPQDTDIAPHVTVFDTILSEIKTALEVKE